MRYGMQIIAYVFYITKQGIFILMDDNMHSLQAKYASSVRPLHSYTVPDRLVLPPLRNHNFIHIYLRFVARHAVSVSHVYSTQ